MSYITLDVHSLQTADVDTETSANSYSTCGNATISQANSSPEDDSNPQFNCECNKELLNAANSIPIMKDGVGVKKETVKDLQCPKLKPYWIYIRLWNFRELIRLTLKSKLIIKVYHVSMSRTKEETPIDQSIFGETVTTKDCPASHFTRVIMLNLSSIVSNVCEFIKIDVLEHNGPELSSSILLSEISIPIKLNLGSNKSDDTMLFVTERIMCKTQMTIKNGYDMDFTLAIGSLAQIDNLEVKIESSTKVQRWWKRRNFDRVGNLITEKDKRNELKQQKCAKLIQQMWRQHRQRKIPSDNNRCDDNTTSKFVTRTVIKGETLLNRIRTISDRSNQNGSPPDTGLEDKAESISAYPTYEIEIKLGKCLGIREMLALWEEGPNVNANININRSGFFVTFSILARSKTNPTAPPELMHFSTAIKMINTIKCHQIMLSESYKVLLDNSELLTNYIQSEMMEAKLWFIPVVTDLMKRYRPSCDKCGVKIPEKGSLVGTTKCPLYTLTGSTAVSYFCPWRLEKGNEIDAVGKIQISFGLNGSTTDDDLTVINLESSFPSSSPNTIFDWDLPDQINCILSKEKLNKHGNCNLIEDLISKIAPVQHGGNGGTKLPSEKTDSSYRRQENNNYRVSHHRNSQKNKTKRHKKSEVPKVCTVRCVEAHDRKISDVKGSSDDAKHIETKVPYNSKRDLINSDVIERSVGLNAEDILPVPKENRLFQSRSNYATAPSKIYEENESPAYEKWPDELTSKYDCPKVHQDFDDQQFKLKWPVGGLLSCDDTNRVSCDTNSEKYSISSDDVSKYKHKIAMEVDKVIPSNFSSDESSTYMHDPQQHTSHITQIYNSSSSSSSSSGMKSVTSEKDVGKRNSQSGRSDSKYSDGDSSSSGSFSVTQLRDHRSTEESSNICHEDEFSSSEIESIDLSSDSSSWA